MDNKGFDKKVIILEQFIIEEDSNKNSLELKQDDNVKNTECLECHASEIVHTQEAEVGNDVKNVLKQLDDTLTDYLMRETHNGNTLDVIVEKEALGIDTTIRNNLTEDALKEEMESTVLPIDSFIIRNTPIETIDKQELEVLTMEQTQIKVVTQNETNDSVIECIADHKSGDVLVQKEALGTDINTRENFTENATKEDSAVVQTHSFIIQNTHIENNDEQAQEFSTMEQPQISNTIQIETNDCVIDYKVGLKSALSETSTSLKNAKRESKVLETGKTMQNALIGEVEKLGISEKIANRQNESEVIVKNNSQSLQNLLVYSDDDEYDDGQSNDTGENNDVDKIRDKEDTVSSSDSESDSDSDSDSDPESSKSDDSSSESEIEASKKNIATLKITNKANEEHYIADSPHVADLSKLEVDYEKEEFSHIGEISGIIETIVTITTISGTPVYDLGSILFIEDNASKKPLGEIFDVIGPVASPVYCIGFKSAKEIKELGFKPKMKVFSAPNSHLSHYVFLKQLLEAKHTDAGLSDEELSSDEYISDSGDESLPQKRKFPTGSKNGIENHRNGNTRGRGRPTMKHHNYRNHPVEPKAFNGWHTQTAVGRRQQTSFFSNFSGTQPSFNPSVPPPLYQNNSGWITRPNAHPPPSWNNGESNDGTQNCNTPPNLRTPPPQWNINPSFNGVPNKPPPPPPHWNSCPRLGFPPNVRPPQPFAGYQQNTPSDHRIFTGNHRGSYPANPYATPPPRWHPRTHPYQPIRYGSSFPNAPPMTGSNQSVNYPGKDVQ